MQKRCTRTREEILKAAQREPRLIITNRPIEQWMQADLHGLELEALINTLITACELNELRKVERRREGR